jgi:NTE family protein
VGKRLVLLCVLLLLIVGLLQCRARPNQYDSLQVETLETLRQSTEVATTAPVPGLALGGGGVRGFVHLGVFKALDEAGIRVPVVVGSSAGAIAAALYATGQDYTAIEAAVGDLSSWQVIDPVISRQGLVNGQALASWVNDVVDQTPLEALEIRTGITVTDLA